MIPRHSMNPDQYCQALGIPRSTLKQWLRPRGILHGVKRELGVYSPADVVLGFVLLEMQHLLGERSERAAEYVIELGPRIRAMVNARQMPPVFKVKIGDGPVTITIDLTAVHDNLIAEPVEY